MNESGSSLRRLLLIANPVSGGGRGMRLAGQLAEALRARGAIAETYSTTCAGDATVRARIAGNEPWDALVAIGGDGTVNEVLNGMPEPSRPLGVLPVGTANVLALELGLPRAVGAAAAVLAAGRTRRLAIGRCGDRRFLLFCGVGVDGAVVQRLRDAPNRTLGKRKWLGPIVHTIRHWPQFSLRATFPDGEVLADLSSVLVTRVRNFGGVVMLPREISADSGQLHVLCFRQRSRRAWLWQGLRGLCRCMRKGGDLLLRSTNGVRIDGDAPCQVDGDFGGVGSVSIDLDPKPAQVIAPLAQHAR